MKRRLIYFLLILVTGSTFPQICGLPSKIFKGIPIFDSQSSIAVLDYDNCDQNTNGEQMVIACVLRDADVVFDVGANCGAWSKLVRKKNSKIKLYAFEPVNVTYQLLLTNLKDLDVNSYCIAFSNFNGPRNFYYYSNNSELSTHYRRDQSTERACRLGIPSEITVDYRSLDSFCAENSIHSVDFLKIDTEGSELDVLMGASILLSKRAIKVIQFEYGGTFLAAGITLKNVWDLLNAYGYKIHRITSKGLVGMPYWIDFYENYRYSNYLAFVEDHNDKFD